MGQRFRAHPSVPIHSNPIPLSFTPTYFLLSFPFLTIPLPFTQSLLLNMAAPSHRLVEDLDGIPAHRRLQDPGESGPRLDIHADRILQLQTELANLTHRVDRVEVRASCLALLPPMLLLPCGCSPPEGLERIGLLRWPVGPP